MKKIKRLSLFLFLLWILPSTSWAHPSIAVDLSILEALPNDPKQKGYKRLPGLKRVQEPLTVGVPLPTDADTPVFKLNNFVLLSVDGGKELVGQFRVLKLGADGKHIKWLLVDTQVDVDAGKVKKDVRIFTGSSLKVPDLAKEDANSITIDTGAAVYVINKKKFNLFDQVTVGGVTLVASGQSPGVVLRGEDNKEYKSSNDSNAKVVLEENGPVRVAVMAKGSHVSDDGKRFLDFTVRMHFYRGKRRARVIYTLRNASKSLVKNASFKSVELVVQTTLKPDAFAVRNHTDETTGKLAAGSSVEVFQGENNQNSIRGGDFTKKVWPTGVEGYVIKQDGKELAKGDRSSPISMMYAQVAEKDQKSVVIGTRYAAGWWPQGLTVRADGSVRVGVFPPGNDKLYTVPFRSHTTREHLFHFAKGVSKARDVFYKFQYPLVARLKDSDKYNRRLALWEKLSSFLQEWDYYNRNKWPYDDRPDATNNRRPVLIFPRFIDWSVSGNLYNYDLAKIALHNYIRQDNFLLKQEVLSGGYYIQAEQRFRYYADRAIPHSDDFNGAKAADEVPELKGGEGGLKMPKDLEGGDQIPTTHPYFTGSYRHAYGLSAWYYHTGDERFKEAYQAWGEHMQTQASWNESARGLAWNIFNWVDLYEFTQDKVYRELAWNAIKKEILDPVMKLGEVGGVDRTRGFFVSRKQATSKKRTLSAAVSGAMLLNAVGRFYDVAAEGHAQKDQMRSLLEGLSRFVAQERWTSSGEKPGEYGYPSSFFVDQKAEDPRQNKDWGGGIQDTYLSFYFGYLLTGQKLFLERGAQMLKASAFNPGKTYWFQDLPSRQTMQQLIEFKEEYSVWWTLPMASEPVKGKPGSYRLRWVVPENVTAYWIKYSDKPIVSWLNYNSKTQKYKYDPSKHTAFFAARDIADEPKPIESGKPQCHVVSGLEPGKKYYFAARFFSNDSTPPPKPPATCRASSPAEQSTVGDGSMSDAASSDNSGRCAGPNCPPQQTCGCTAAPTWFGLLWWSLFLLIGLRAKRRRRR